MGRRHPRPEHSPCNRTGVVWGLPLASAGREMRERSLILVGWAEKGAPGTWDRIPTEVGTLSLPVSSAGNSHSLFPKGLWLLGAGAGWDEGCRVQDGMRDAGCRQHLQPLSSCQPMGAAPAMGGGSTLVSLVPLPHTRHLTGSTCSCHAGTWHTLSPRWHTLSHQPQERQEPCQQPGSPSLLLGCICLHPNLSGTARTPGRAQSPSPSPPSTAHSQRARVHTESPCPRVG